MKGVWSVLKIHIVQKGDTLWELSQEYGVDFEELKQMNSQISSPDMIMPGMKITIPSSKKAVKKETMPAKGIQKKETTQPYKDTSPKPMPVIKEDDNEKKMMVKPEMPMQPEMPVAPLPQMPTQPMMQTPIMEQEFQNYTTINFPQMPHYHHEAEKEMPKKEQIKAQPMPQPEPKPMPMPQPMPHHAQMIPLCCHIVHPCFPSAPFPVMANMSDGFFPHHQMQHSMPPGNMNFNNEPSPHMGMQFNPMHNAGNNDCGCQSNDPFEQYAKPPSPYRNDHQEMQQPTLHSQQQMPPDNLYPPQFAVNQNNNIPYPNPPGYPDFSMVNDKDEDDKTSE